MNPDSRLFQIIFVISVFLMAGCGNSMSCRDIAAYQSKSHPPSIWHDEYANGALVVTIQNILSKEAKGINISFDQLVHERWTGPGSLPPRNWEPKTTWKTVTYNIESYNRDLKSFIILLPLFDYVESIRNVRAIYITERHRDSLPLVNGKITEETLIKYFESDKPGAYNEFKNNLLAMGHSVDSFVDMLNSGDPFFQIDLGYVPRKPEIVKAVTIDIVNEYITRGYQNIIPASSLSEITIQHDE